MATMTHGFTVSSFASKSSTSALRMGLSYEEQLKQYNNPPTPPPATAAATPPAPQTTEPPAVTGLSLPPQQTAPPPPVQAVAPSPPVPLAVTAPPQQPPQQVIEVKNSNSNSPLAVVGVLFLGLPLWFLLASQVFYTPPVVDTPAQITAANQIVLPESLVKSAASPSGVVVLSQPITKAEVRGLFDLWNDALKTGDPATVTQRYGKDGVLLPTLSDVPRTDFEGIKDYFVGFLSKKPVGKILEGEIYVGNNWAQDAGIYEFTFEDGSKVKARYSFVYAFEDGKWMISHHHSSLMPQEVVRPAKITETEVRGLFDLWNNALHTGEPYTVAARYSKDAVLLPTLSDKARYTTDEIADYFVGFLRKKPDGKILEGNVKIGPNWAQDAGIYEFTFNDGSKTRGRYSFVYTYENGKWMISNHHSSIMPEPAVAAFKKAAELEKTVAAQQVSVVSENVEVQQVPAVTITETVEIKVEEVKGVEA